MNCIRLHQRSSRTNRALFAICALLLISGCAVTPSVESLTSQYGYVVEQSPVQIDATATVEVTDTMTPALDARLGKGQYYNDYRAAVVALIRSDMDKSGLFARIIRPVDGAQPDYRIKITSVEDCPARYSIRVRMQAFDGATGKETSDHAAEASAPILLGLTFDKRNPYLQRIMTELKAALAADLQQDQNIKKSKKPLSQDETDSLSKASLAELLVSVDKSELLARERNRALIAAKNQQLPAILRDKKTDELAALVTKIEQTILDLNHECEVAKDRAQQSVADNGTPRDTSDNKRGRATATVRVQNIDDLRGLAICYRERIELLKPVLGAIKEEIANRNR